MIPDELTCETASVQLSARLDDELADARALESHLAGCAPCRGLERELAHLGRGFRALRAEPIPRVDLWPVLERRARRRTAARLLARAAAALVGFLGLHGAARLLDVAQPAPAERHLFERLAPGAPANEFFAALPEYRVLRAFPPTEEPR
jgi:hypothetical protein